MDKTEQAEIALGSVWTALTALLRALDRPPTTTERRAIDAFQAALAAYTVAECERRDTRPQALNPDTDPLARLGVQLGMWQALASR
jgi:hypothetical protein